MTSPHAPSARLPPPGGRRIALMSIERAKAICSYGDSAAHREPYLQAAWKEHGNDYLRWWDRRPVASSEADIAQWYEMARTTAAVALEMLDAATTKPLTASRLQTPSDDEDATFAAVMNADLESPVTYFELEQPHDIGSSELADCMMFGALCWRLESSGLSVIRFADQAGNDSCFGQVIFDAAGTWNADRPLIAVHPGLTVVSRDGTVILPVDIDFASLCGAVVRAGAHMAHLIVGALWSLESSRR